jgi:anti-sigma B factor antagonist
MQYQLLNPPATGHVVILQGDFDALGARSVRPLFEDLAKHETGDVVVDFRAVEFIDASGVGALVFLHKRLVASDRALQIVGAEGQPRELLELLRLDKVIPVNQSTVVAPAQDMTAVIPC